MASDAALGAADGSVILNGGVLAATGSSSLNFLRNMQVGPAGGGIFVNSGSTFNLFGAISGTGTFSKLGNGTLALLTDNPLSGAVHLGSGSGTIRLYSSAGALRSVPLFTLGGTLTLANTTSHSFNTNRIGDEAHLVLNGGAIEMLGGSMPVFERVGTITLGRGANFLNISSSGRLLASELVRQNRSVLRHSGTLILDTPPTLVGGDGTIGTVNAGIVPWIGLVTYTPAGLRPLTTFLPDIPAGSITTANVRLASGSFTPAAPATINALGIATASLLGTSTVTITSGVISGSGTIQTPIDFGSAEGLVHASGSLTIGGVISGSNGLTISQTGSSPITLAAANVYTGTTTLNRGTFLLPTSIMPNTAGPFGSDTSPIVLNESAALSASATTTFGRDLIVRSDLDRSTSRFPNLSGASLTVSGNILLEGILGVSIATFTGNITGPGVIRVSNTATFSGNNTFTGGVWATRSVIVGSDTALGSGTAVFSPMSEFGIGSFAVASLTAVGGPRTLGNPFAIGNLTIAGAFSTTLTGPVQLNGGVTTLSIMGAPLATISGPVSDGLLHFNGGRLILAGNNSQYATTVTSGTMTILNSNALGGASGSPPLLTSIGALGTLELFGSLAIPPHRLEVASGSIGLRSILGDSMWSGDVVRTANALRIAVDSDTLSIAGKLDLTDGAFEKLGNGSLLVGNLRSTGPVTISGGRVRIRPSGTDEGVSNVGALNIAGGATPTARLELTDNNLVIDYTGASPIATIRAQIAAGRAGGAWNGNGITSSIANANVRALGYAENSVLGLGTFMGQALDSTSLIVRQTFYGDSDLDGDVDVADLGNLASHWQTNADWSGGDFTYNGFVDTADLGLLASRWQAGVDASLKPTARPWALTEALSGLGLPNVSVPEPGTLGLLIGTVVLQCRRRCRG